MPDVETARTLDELVTLYELEHSLRDIYVEGCTDQRVISQYLSECGFHDIQVREISTVSISFSQFAHRNLEDNRRSRVIYLAQELEHRVNRDLYKNVACLADSDFDVLFGITHSGRLLLFTDFTALELYAAYDRILSKFLTVVLGRRRSNATKTLNKILPVLQSLFLIRAVNKQLNLGLESIDYCKLLSIKQDGKLLFDHNEYIKRLLNKNCRFELHDQFLAAMSALADSLPGEPRHTIHGHDLIMTLRWYASHAFRPKSSAYDVDFFQGALLGCLETMHLDSFALFQELKRRFSSYT